MRALLLIKATVAIELDGPFNLEDWSMTPIGRRG